GVALDDVEKAHRGGGVGLVLAEHGVKRLGRRADGGDGRAKLVRDIGDKVAKDGLELAERRDVEEDDQLAAQPIELRHADEEAAGLHAGELDLAAAVGLDELLELVVANDLERPLARHVGRKEEHLAEGGVDRGDAAAAVEDEEAFLHRGEDAGGEVALALQLAEGLGEAGGEVVEREAEGAELVATDD